DRNDNVKALRAGALNLCKSGDLLRNGDFFMGGDGGVLGVEHEIAKLGNHHRNAIQPRAPFAQVFQRLLMPPRAPVAPASVMNQRGSVVHLCSGAAKVLRRAPRDRGGRYLAVRRRAAALKGISEEVQLDRRGSAQDRKSVV